MDFALLRRRVLFKTENSSTLSSRVLRGELYVCATVEHPTMAQVASNSDNGVE